MTVQELSSELNLSVLVEGDLSKEVTGGYCGDLLSWVMSRCQSGDCWFTVMGNINCAAVAVLTDCACVVLTENAPLDGDAKSRAQMQGINILQSDKNAYQLAVELGKLI